MDYVESSTADNDGYKVSQEMKQQGIDLRHHQLTASKQLRRYAAARELQLRCDIKSFHFAKGLCAGDKVSREVAAFSFWPARNSW